MMAGHRDLFIGGDPHTAEEGGFKAMAGNAFRWQCM